MKWKFYEGKNFDTYINQGGLDLGNYVSQMAETELPDIENFMESSLRGKANIFVYNSYDEFKQSNIGLGSNAQNTNGVTTLPNNKMVVYFDGNHQHLKMQIRQGIAQMILNNLLFGEDIGEVASNQALLDLPKWLTDGYISYAAENWSTQNDDDLKNEMLNGEYKTFYHFAFKKPTLAGHSFWNFIAEKYKPENVTYFLYLARIYKSLNTASVKICKKRMKPLLAEFMEYQQDKYDRDIKRRRNAPKGNIIADEDVSDKEFYRFQANPNPKNKNYVVVEFKKGFYSVKYFEDYEPITIMHKGIRTHQGDINPNYPILAWDVKGTKILCIYWEDGKTKMFVYDVIAKYKRNKQEIKDFDQILDANYLLDDNTLVLSAAKNGHTDIYTYKIEEQKATQITNDVYDDLNPSLVSFANRTGIIYSSNRPSPNASLADTVQPSRYRFNIFLVDILNYSAAKQITQLTNLKYGNATMPMQYNTNHFTFVSDENGVGNRWAGFFNSQRAGLDTLYFVGDEMMRNPSAKEMDSALVAWRKQEPDSIAYFQVYKDTTYTFPITNYQSSLIESRVAGNNGQISETRREGNEKYLYKLKVNEDALYKRNVTAPPTEYMKRLMNADKIAQGKATSYIKQSFNDSSKTKVINFFQNEFADEKPDTSLVKIEEKALVENTKYKARLFNSKTKFQVDNLQSGIANNLLVTRYQPYAGGFGPIQLSNGNNINFAFQAGVYDLMEDYRINGGVRLGTNLKDKDVFVNYQNYKRRLDWGVSYYRSNLTNAYQYRVTPGDGVFNADLKTNIYQGNISYPFDEARSLRITAGIRSDRITLKPSNLNLGGAPDPIGLFISDSVAYNIMGRFEFVHDNTITPAMNIWEGLRWKAYMDFVFPGADKKFVPFQETFNFGVDIRKYTPIYRNCIWALRVAADFSWGSKKIIYYLGGVDGDLLLNDSKFNTNNRPASDQTYAFQSLAVNMRGYNQNIANGNNAFVINSEIRLPIFSTFFNQPVNNAFLRNLQLVQFLDLGTAWNGKYNGIQRPVEIYSPANPNINPITVKIDAGGLGPFAGGYGFGVRSTLFGYFLKFDVAWPMKGVFVGKPLGYFALGLDF
ncbi:MAG: hypothetical protein ACOVO1_03970 [Chitinophagaceae bacterium]